MEPMTDSISETQQMTCPHEGLEADPANLELAPVKERAETAPERSDGKTAEMREGERREATFAFRLTGVKSSGTARTTGRVGAKPEH